MPWHQVAFELAADRAGLAEAALEVAGAEAITWGEAGGSVAVLEPAPGETRLWSRVRVEALFAADADHVAIREAVSGALGGLPAGWQESALADQAWERAWLDHFKPRSFGTGLWVVPWGMTPPAPDAVNIRLDPGLAFGTGTHPSTELCLEALAAEPPVGETVIDYGCGSGVLAVAALLLGADRVVAVDNDPQACLATRENAERNRVADRLVVGDPGIALPAADRVIANILAGVLQSLAPVLTHPLREGGRMTLAGILADQAAAVRSAYEPACRFAPVVHREGWVRLDAERQAL